MISNKEFAVVMNHYLTFAGYLYQTNPQYVPYLVNANLGIGKEFDGMMPEEVALTYNEGFDLMAYLRRGFKFNAVAGAETTLRKLPNKAKFMVDSLESLSLPESHAYGEQLLWKTLPQVVLRQTFHAFDEHANLCENHATIWGFSGTSKVVAFNLLDKNDISRIDVEYERRVNQQLDNPAAFAAQQDLGQHWLHWLFLELDLHQYISTKWLAKISCEGAPSLQLPTDPTGLYALFKLRDKLPSQVRRPQLLHWVEEHWRKTRNDPEMEALVRGHLRGVRTFTQGDLRVELAEPPDIRAKISEATRDRLRLQKQRKLLRRRQK